MDLQPLFFMSAPECDLAEHTRQHYVTMCE